ncbi:MAG: hypothetical protein LUE99_08425 [Bacteroides sp.]|nr:hypothetical protein [Bacteroides sp.]
MKPCRNLQQPFVGLRNPAASCSNPSSAYETLPQFAAALRRPTKPCRTMQRPSVGLRKGL